MKVFIQARMTSHRLPGKVLINIKDKKNTLDMIIDKLKTIFLAKNIIVLTSKQRRDNEIVKYCKKKKLIFFEAR